MWGLHEGTRGHRDRTLPDEPTTIVLATSSSLLQVCEGYLEGDKTTKRNTLLSCGTDPELLASADVQLKLFAQELQFESLNTQLVLSWVKTSRGSSSTPPPVRFP